MWNMFEGDFECGTDACDGPGPPPKFHIPPPARPPFMQSPGDSTSANGIECNEDTFADIEMCAAFPVSKKTIFHFGAFLWHNWDIVAKQN